MQRRQQKLQLATIKYTFIVTYRVRRHGMPPPASNHTGTAFCFPN